jgi:zinc/manganese transport system substrate-binding protein
MLLRRLIFLISVLLPIATANAESGPRVVASFSILGDLVAQVGGDRITLKVLVGPDQDAHVYQPTPTDAQQLTMAQLVVVNGLGFEGWIERLIKASGYRGPIIVATQDLLGLADEEGKVDPHVWQNPQHVHRYIHNITEGLIAIDPAGEETYRQNARQFLKQLEQLDQEIRASIATLPQDRRTVVTSHDAFAYFGKAYGLKFVAPQGMNTDSEASARDVAELIRQIQREKIPAVFVENISDPRLLQQIARETRAGIGGTLYSDALSDAGGDAGTYLAMMSHNLSVLVHALQTPSLEE